MAKSKYVDNIAITQVIGCVFNSPNLLDYTDKYIITENDFQEEFHKIVFGAIFKLQELGAQQVSLASISDFLTARPKSEAIYKANKGEEWLIQAADNAMPAAFDFYYNRMKKMSLLRAYDSYGIDVSSIYDPDNIFDSKLKEKQEEILDNSSLETIAKMVDDKIEQIKAEYVDNVFGESVQAGTGIYDLIEKLKKRPEVGVPLYGPLMNTVTRGARLRKFYLRSAPTGVGNLVKNY